MLICCANYNNIVNGRLMLIMIMLMTIITIMIMTMIMFTIIYRFYNDNIAMINIMIVISQ